ncbi:hypothetical protein [Micromonospora sp. DT227]|uniref:hypothetical protein n=1 Tax=Micromonospora sp. DT227 TaxID=3393433 RepID=UPI003CE91167
MVKRWWNGSWGRLTRRDIWLVRESQWTVVARAGDTDTGTVLRWTYDSRDDASAMIDRLLRADNAGQWREQRSGSTEPADPRRVTATQKKRQH